MKPKLILIAGGTASGKTELSKCLKTFLEEKTDKTVSLLRMDFYYKDLNQIKKKNPKKINWDHPKNINWKLLKKDLKKILNGETIYNYAFNFDTCFYSDIKIEIKSSEYIILEGIFSLYNKKINKSADKKFYIKSKKNIRFYRRYERDKRERFKDFKYEEFEKKWREKIYPMHKKYISPTAKFADRILKNSENELNDFKEMLLILLKELKIS